MAWELGALALEYHNSFVKEFGKAQILNLKNNRNLVVQILWEAGGL